MREISFLIMPELQNPFFSSFLRLSIIRASLKENRACNMMSLLTILIWTGRKHARELQWRPALRILLLTDRMGHIGNMGLGE